MNVAGNVAGNGPVERWLAIAEEEFLPADSGGRVESLNMLRAAVAAGIELHVLVPGLPVGAAGRYRRALDGATVEGIARRPGPRSHLSPVPYVFVSRPVPRELLARIRADHASTPYAAVLAVSFRVAHLGTAAARLLDLPLLVRPHNVESEYFEQLARSTRFPRNLPYRAEAWKLRRAEAGVHADPVVTAFADIAERDAARRSHRTAAPVLHVPPFVPVPQAEPSAAAARQRPTVLFLGALDGANNRDGIGWFVERCWPALRAQVPGVALHVVGRRAPEGLSAQLSAAGVRLTADAPDVGPHLAAAAVFVNPVRRGAGVNIKVVEALAAGLPVVTTTTGGRGMHWRDGEHLVVADEPAEFTAAVAGLLRDPARRAALGAAGRRFVAEELDGVRQVNRMRETLRAAAARRSRRTGP